LLIQSVRFGIENISALLTGSSGWLNVIEKYAKAKTYCDQSVEVKYTGTSKNERKIIMPISGEWMEMTQRRPQNGSGHCLCRCCQS
jgi:hypothetical protein